MAEKNPVWLPIERVSRDPVERALRVLWSYEDQPPRINHSQRYSLTVHWMPQRLLDATLAWKDRYPAQEPDQWVEYAASVAHDAESAEAQLESVRRISAQTARLARMASNDAARINFLALGFAQIDDLLTRVTSPTPEAK